MKLHLKTIPTLVKVTEKAFYIGSTKPKKPETRQNRINEIVSLCEKNIKSR